MNPNIFKCFCEVRNTQTFITKCLDDNSLSNEDRDFLIDLVQRTSKISNKIVQYYPQKGGDEND
ncbi:hypothetical protein BN1180_04660 [Peribacillus simplex]|uniref:Four helix bundle protein n=1 Tax=Peribacillus simplex TaxID=1478 RepID=A0AAN2PKS8_9BACI|nr:hypothetical protein [Peribacillus frigoritolerans]MCP1154794.1 hypothetical protein [Peribacillus frigoritolerans]CEG34457.1 hypothetical protein BN1180_04660 [Peribacillus simplex]